MPAAEQIRFPPSLFELTPPYELAYLLIMN